MGLEWELAIPGRLYFQLPFSLQISSVCMKESQAHEGGKSQTTLLCGLTVPENVFRKESTASH